MAVSDCIRTCRQCGKEFRRTAVGQPTKYCGADCKNRSRGLTGRKTHKAGGPCAVSGCDSPSVIKGHCRFHYGRSRRSPECISEPKAFEPGRRVRKPCELCGLEMEGIPSIIKNRRFCSNRCKAESRRVDRTASCEVCGSQFEPYSSTGAPGGWTRCCSDQCARASRRIKSGSLSRSSRVRVVSHHGHCDGCGKHYRKSVKGQVFCAPECRPSAYEWTPESKECTTCGESFMQERRWQAKCSAECEQESNRRLRRIAKSRRRARIRGRAHEAIDPIRVFERDGWRCQMCHKRLNPADRGTHKPLAPELDHVVPLAAGGAHTWGNVQLACRACNNAKGATPAGQLGLAIPA